MSKECRHEAIHHMVAWMALQEDRIRRANWSGHYTGPRRGGHAEEDRALL